METNTKIKLSDKIMWTLEEARSIINYLRKLNSDAHGYYIGITGSVLYKGESNNDLDLTLYPHGSLHSDYRPMVDFIVKHLEGYDVVAIERDEEFDYKLVIGMMLPGEKKLQLFITNFTFLGRLDSYNTHFVLSSAQS